jgi:arginine decarboxylase
MPILIRFSDILRSRIHQLNETFAKAFAEHEYAGAYMGVYPIKVNQQRHVVEEIVRYGKRYKFGLEAGFEARASGGDGSAGVARSAHLCNGYKDIEYIEMALWGMKLGKTVRSGGRGLRGTWEDPRPGAVMNVSPSIGFRMKLSTRGSGRWQESNRLTLQVRPDDHRDAPRRRDAQAGGLLDGSC